MSSNDDSPEGSDSVNIVTPPSAPFLSPKQAAQAEATLWRRGALRYLIGAMPILPPRVGVDSIRKAYDWLGERWGTGGGHLVILAHRRFAKSSLIFIKAGEIAVKYPRSRIAVVCDTKEHAEDITTQVAEPFYERAPAGIKPTWVKTEKAWTFPNGSRIEMYGGEKSQFSRARGSKFRAVFMEEARDHPHLRLSVETVYRQALADTQGSQLVFVTTVPEQEDSDFERYYREAASRGNTWEMPLSANPDYPPEFYTQMAREALGGEMGGDFQREFECKWIHSDDVRLIVPEFTPEARREIIRSMDPPPWARWYHGLDPGGQDPTGLIWFWYDDKADHVHIARELQIREQVTSKELARRKREQEVELFRHMLIPQLEPYADPSDGTMLHNLAVDEGLTYRASDNDDLWGNMDKLRRLVQERAISIDPDCVTLIHEMSHCRRTKDGKKIQRDKHGHGDVLMALYYPIRNLVRKPRPKVKMPAGDPLREMGLVPAKPKHNIIGLLRRPTSGVALPLPGMRRRLR
jgi:hypothetical protein